MTDIAHELRTPLTVVRSQVEAVADGVWEATPERLALCAAEIERLSDLIGEVESLTPHEIGNPMAAIMGIQQLILDGDVDADGTVDFVRRMKRETERIHHVLRQLLDYARPAKVAKPLACAASIGSVDEAIRNACALTTDRKSVV